MRPLHRATEVDVSELPEVKNAAGQLHERLKVIAHRGRLSNERFEETVQKMRGLVKEHRRVNRARGIPFPDLTLLAIPRFGGVHLHRTDIDDRSLQTIVLNMTSIYPEIQPDELAAAIHEAYPYFKPSAVNFELRRKPKTIEGSV